MKILSEIPDKVVAGKSHLVEMRIGEYIRLARVVLEKNEFQRKRVRASKTTYSLLKKDLKVGCVIPPIVLAHRRKDNSPDAVVDVARALNEAPEEFIILDGLQRSFTLIDVAEELSGADLRNFLNRSVRCEIYEGVNRAGILYRMLTLNTGQTTMSLRHQIEIMYLDYLDQDIDGVRLLREVDGGAAKKINEYNFREMVEGFNSYIERNEMPMDKADVLDNISGLENLAIEENDADLFSEFISLWHSFISQISSLEIEVDDEGYDDERSDDEDDASKKRDDTYVWAKNGVKMFKRAQAVSGFGAALGLLRDEEQFSAFDELNVKVKIGADTQQFMFGPFALIALQKIVEKFSSVGSQEPPPQSLSKLIDNMRYYCIVNTEKCEVDSVAEFLDNFFPQLLSAGFVDGEIKEESPTGAVAAYAGERTITINKPRKTSPFVRKALFGMIPYEPNPFFSFFYSWQIVEHFMQLEFERRLGDFVAAYNASSGVVNAKKSLDKINEIAKEKNRVRGVFSKGDAMLDLEVNALHKKIDDDLKARRETGSPVNPEELDTSKERDIDASLTNEANEEEEHFSFKLYYIRNVMFHSFGDVERYTDSMNNLMAALSSYLTNKCLNEN